QSMHRYALRQRPQFGMCARRVNIVAQSAVQFRRPVLTAGITRAHADVTGLAWAGEDSVWRTWATRGTWLTALNPVVTPACATRFSLPHLSRKSPLLPATSSRVAAGIPVTSCRTAAC